MTCFVTQLLSVLDISGISSYQKLVSTATAFIIDTLGVSLGRMDEDSGLTEEALWPHWQALGFVVLLLPIIFELLRRLLVAAQHSMRGVYAAAQSENSSNI